MNKVVVRSHGEHCRIIATEGRYHRRPLVGGPRTHYWVFTPARAPRRTTVVTVPATIDWLELEHRAATT